MRKLARTSTTLIIATHAVDLVSRFVSRIVLVGEQRILFDGAMRDLVAKPDLLARARLRAPWPAELWAAIGAGSPEPGPAPRTIGDAIAWLAP